MSLTPSVRMNSTWSLKLTPSNSPYLGHSSAKSPSKASRQELSLSLKQVIGNTTSSANGFDCLPSASAFAFTAGAAAVIATVGEDLRITQRFYRARPSTLPLNPSTSIYEPSTPKPVASETRNRTAVSLRDAGFGISPVGSPGNDWIDSPGNKSWTARERVKAATCVSFSPDGKYLAVGETGYKPRVLIFSTSREASSDTPLTSLSDHTFGVRCVAFSPDSQYLASLGSANDGFLYLWSINNRNGSATLYASNKCTTNVNQLAWIGNNVVTVGTRHVKLWRLEDQNDLTQGLTSPSHKILPGRNCLLGPLLEASFTVVVAIGPDKAVIGSDKGDVCLLDDSHGTQQLSKVAQADFGITAMAVDSLRRLHVAGSQGQLAVLKLSDILGAPSPQSPSMLTNAASSAGSVIVMAALNDHMITIDSRHAIKLWSLASSNDAPLDTVLQQLAAHGGAVYGVQALPKRTEAGEAFFTWSAEGNVIFWSHDCESKRTTTMELEQPSIDDIDFPNELKIVRALRDMRHLVFGDKFGILRILDVETGQSVFDFKAHAGEITDIAIHEGSTTHIASSGRDRTVQVFANSAGSWELLQTLDEHVGAVTALRFSGNGNRLLSCSSDRTVVVRESVSREVDGKKLAAFLIIRTITLKASPVSMVLDCVQQDILFLSTVDRQLHRYDTRTGHFVFSCKASDSEGGDAVVLSSLVHVSINRGSAVLAGVSSTDKSIRLYDEAGVLIGRDWGHTEGVSDIALIPAKSDGGGEATQRSLVTVAIDGTIFVWNLDSRSSPRHDVSKSMDLMGLTPTGKDLLVSKPPSRRVLSQSELVSFQRSPEGEASTPTGSRTPRLRKKTSRFSLAPTPKVEPPPLPSSHGVFSPPGSADPTSRRLRQRSPSPPSPRNARYASARRPSLDVRARTKSSTTVTSSTAEFSSLTASTEQVCRNLRAYRKKLAASSDSLSNEAVRELERELGLTARAVGEKAKSKGVDESVMVKLLDQYSERLVEMLDEKIAKSLARQGRAASEGTVAVGAGADGGDGAGDETVAGAEEKSENLAPGTSTIAK